MNINACYKGRMDVWVGEVCAKGMSGLEAVGEE